jgi:hypothetical protein
VKMCVSLSRAREDVSVARALDGARALSRFLLVCAHAPDRARALSRFLLVCAHTLDGARALSRFLPVCAQRDVAPGDEGARAVAYSLSSNTRLGTLRLSGAQRDVAPGDGLHLWGRIPVFRVLVLIWAYSVYWNTYADLGRVSSFGLRVSPRCCRYTAFAVGRGNRYRIGSWKGTHRSFRFQGAPVLVLIGVVAQVHGWWALPRRMAAGVAD